MKALVFKAAEQPMVVDEIENPIVGSGQVLVKLDASSMNHRDVWMTKGLYPNLTPGVAPGSCGVGWVNEREVIINPNVNWGNNPDYPDHGTYSILGMPVNGTFAEYIVVDKDRLADKPSHMNTEEAAALPLAGLTAYRALFGKAKATFKDKVLISGVGGGVALFACQFAIAMGADVYVTSGSNEKIQKAMDLGAKGGANYKDEKWQKAFRKEHGGMDVVIDSAGGPGFDNLLKVCNPQARIVMYGGTRGMGSFSPPILFWQELQIFGSTMGSDQEFVEMVKFVNKYKVKPVIDSVYSYDDSQLAFDKMDRGEQFGKIILKSFE